jgi:membrane fusion protein (multidrug efflux system)
MSTPPDPGSQQPPPPPAPAPDDLGFDLPPPAAPSKTRLLALVAVVIVGLGAAFASAYLPRRQARAALEEGVKAGEGAAPRVEVVTPQVVASERALVLSGSVQPLEESVVYARASGYVRKWLVDIGDKVTEGQVLAEIDTPELDQELAQARAQLAQGRASLLQAQANRDLSQTNLKRYEQLVSGGVASQQDLDQRRGQARVDEASVTVAQATISAQQANVHRLSEGKTFAKVVAPFAGTVTSRTVERGALVGSGSPVPLFKIAALDPVRVFVAVPQNVAPSVRTGQPATVTVRELPAEPLQGTIARTAGALDRATRTMNTEVRVPNPEGKLLTGMFASVALTLPVPHRVVEVPATALFNGAKGLRLAVVDAENKVHFIPITIERDTGATIQVATGLEGSERVVKLASAELSEGMTVEVQAPH